MITIQQTVDIPPDRRLSLDLQLPETAPSGRVNVVLVFDTSAETAAATAQFPTLEDWKKFPK